ncbi:RNA-metabolising metallo-beta-lactamase [Halolamina pelagica]|uniref:RNA-metabolising metallo-beta-lactamase n=1 Tax=Halolamina pelagica TaxID=699431 RepID=A0A0N8I0A3_9EURY|nr:RNA-metabolising metallo-beta-lactamase [Halolamina pelagica]
MQGAHIYDDIHVSGHLSQEGHYQMLEALQPENVIPAHQNLQNLAKYVDLCESEGYSLGDDVHLSRNGTVHTLTE